MRSRIASLIAIPLIFGANFACAQSGNPSADQIIKSLMPTGDVSKVTTRGIRLAPQAGSGDATAPQAVHHAGVASAGPAAHPEGLAAVNLTVNFASGSAELTPQAAQSLDTLGTALKSEALSHYRFRVEGHTDSVGSPESNRILSEKRAEAVVSYIVSRFGVAADRLQPVGLGSDKPLVATAAQVAEPRNRRVLVVNLGV